MRNPFLLLAMFGMASVAYSQVQAAPVQFAGVVPGTVVTKEVQSIRERRFENLVEQETDFSCGAASLATILKYAYGWTDVTEETVLAGLMEVADPERVRSLGFSLLDLNNYVQSIGLRGRGYEIGPESLEEVSIPVIVLLNLDGYEHFVVMKKARGDRVYIGDPALGNKVMDRDDFLASWNDIIFAVVGDGFDTSTVLLDPAQPLTARRMTDVFSPVPEQQLLDFGFKHSEVF
ncbi:MULTISPECIES: C39 family peptidase [Halomonadaceae]|uniref:C39 family peptidase n=1 Tax=Billgrantia aerodenitrificans TaxID=2733483 RepID=A0ABS9AQE6_9GAMM|nr:MULTISPECIES: C39 family peptidase [Halomonas]MCE8024004.1 C39 family peptidase [Halomonas aerodenitrificans]